MRRETLAGQRVLKRLFPSGWLAPAAVLLVLDPAVAAAQGVSGRVKDAESGLPISSAVVTLRTIHGDSIATTMTNDEGVYRFELEEPGWFALVANALGYAEATTKGFEVEGGAWPTGVDIELSVSAVPLDPIDVTAERKPWWQIEKSYWEWPYWERREWYSKVGIGTFLTEEQVRAFSSVRDIIAFYERGKGKLPRVLPDPRVQRGSGCTSAYYLNDQRWAGVPEVPTDRIIGIEIYRGAAQMPIEYSAPFICDVVAVWTRR